MKNIVEFPKSKIVREAPVNVEIIEKAKEKAVTSFGDQVTDAVIDAALEVLDTYGIDVESDKFVKDFSLTADSLRATVYRALNLPHNLHEFIDTNVKMINRETGEAIIEDENIETESLDTDD